MTKPRSCLLALSLLTCVAANADSLLVFTSGEFSSSGITANGMAADGADWTTSFVINSMPAVSNVDPQSFDILRPTP